MNKAEALVVLHEIFEACKESVVISSVSLDPGTLAARNLNGEYLIKMKCDLDSSSRDSIKPVLTKHRLALIEDNGFATIYSIKAY